MNKNKYTATPETRFEKNKHTATPKKQTNN